MRKMTDIHKLLIEFAMSISEENDDVILNIVIHTTVIVIRNK